MEVWVSIEEASTPAGDLDRLGLASPLRMPRRSWEIASAQRAKGVRPNPAT